ncbi:MAG TPA: alpha/beta fold hydrolase [Arenicellales bacterium]|nr:alpha/beta fold hydrolase [Arenicellales bacterium]
MIYAFGDYRLDSTRFQINRDTETLPVEPQVLELLITLIENRDHVVTRDELLEKVWKGRVVSDTTLSSRIKSARRTIGDDGIRQAWIRTVHGRGFRFVGPVVEVSDDPTDAGDRSLGSAMQNRPDTRYARSGETHIAYHLFGDGPVNLVMMPGFVSHIDNYWDQPELSRYLRRIGSGARVAMFDKRGTGLSDKVEALPGMDERMDDVRAVMDAAGFDTAYLMGVSEGGSLATLFAAYHPERCDGLILYGAFAQFRHWFPDEAALQKLFDYIKSEWGSGRSLPNFAPNFADDPALIHWWGKFERLGATPGAAMTLMRMNSRIDISDVLSSVRVPTLVIHRIGDALIDVEGGRQLAAGIPGARYLELAGADHLPFLGDNTDEIIGAILGFLDRPATPARVDRVLATILLIRFGTAPDPRRSDTVLDEVEARMRRYRPDRIRFEPPVLVATFDAPARALECAHLASTLLRVRNVEHRVGVHAGEIDPGDDKLEDMAVRIASDIAGHARSNEVLASRTIHDLVAGSDVELQDFGEFALPSIGQAWRLYHLLRRRNNPD